MELLPNFRARTYAPELLDAPIIPTPSLFANLEELAQINRQLGGHRISLRGLRQLIAYAPPGAALRVADLGCGGGDTLRALAHWAERWAYPLELIGVDVNPDVIFFMDTHSRAYPQIRGQVADYRTFLQETEPLDIVHCALFCHHLTDAEILELLTLLRAKTRLGFVINDLQRHPLAYYSIWGLTRLLGGSEMVRHDAPLSVRRGFRTEEWRDLLGQVGITHYDLTVQWAFRHLLVVPTA